MRVMVIVKASRESEAGQMPSRELLTEMGKFNEELVNAGVMLAGEGLHPTSRGKRVRFSGKDRTVIDGPFTETKELIAGYWIWKVGSIEEAVNWLKRAPFEDGDEVVITATAPGCFFHSPITSPTAGSAGFTGLMIAKRPGCLRCTSTA